MRRRMRAAELKSASQARRKSACGTARAGGGHSSLRPLRLCARHWIVEVNVLIVHASNDDGMEHRPRPVRQEVRRHQRQHRFTRSPVHPLTHSALSTQHSSLIPLEVGLRLRVRLPKDGRRPGAQRGDVLLRKLDVALHGVHADGVVNRHGIMVGGRTKIGRS